MMGSMELRYEARPDHLLVHASGEFDYEAARQGLSTVIRACNEAGLGKILVDGRGITTLVSIADRFELATQLSTETLEDTAANRGAPLRTTDSMAEAREFLQLGPE